MKIFLVAGVFSMLCACASTYPRQDPTGLPFAEVSGTTLNGTSVSLPTDLKGAPTLLLIGYEQRSQFDIDRWLLGMRDAGLGVRTYEVPTIPGLIPGLWAARIDDGMRSGIPSEEWDSVITLYDDADRVARFLGNENPLPARVVLLDESGHVSFFHDDGYSVATLGRLEDKLLETLGGS
jgi:hypothetical protein